MQRLTLLCGGKGDGEGGADRLLQPLTTHEQLAKALEALLACAQVLEPLEVKLFIVHRLFNRVSSQGCVQ